MDPHGETARLGDAMTEMLHRAGFPLEDLSLSLRRNRGYLSRAFRGRIPLKVLDVFTVLAMVGADPLDFFDYLYPFGGTVMERLRDVHSSWWRGDTPGRALERQFLRAYGDFAFDPEILGERSREVLSGLLRRYKVSQKAASLKMGLGPSALGQALRGNQALTFQHVFGVMEACGRPQARFFAELLSNPGWDPLAAMRWARALDLAEDDFRLLLEQLSAR